MKIKIKEAQVLKDCLQYLAYRPGMYWRNNSGAMPIGNNRFIRFGLKGSSDIIGCRNGNFIAIECKGTGGKLSEDQKHFCDLVEHNSGFYIIAYSIDDLKAAGL